MIPANQVAIIWYPRGNVGFSHAELKVGNEFYRTGGGKIQKRQEDAETMMKKARTEGHKGYFQFNLNLSKPQIEKLSEILKNPEQSIKKYPYCIKGVCNLINESARGVGDNGFKIPKFFTYIPLIAAIFLKIQSKIHPDKVPSIEYFGNNILKDLLTPNFITETAAVSTFEPSAAALIEDDQT